MSGLLFCLALAAPQPALAADVVRETRRSWDAYVQYAWGHDELRPLTRTGYDWYARSLFMTGLDAYDTLRVMGLDGEARRVEDYVDHTLSFDDDMYVKTFEISIRLLGSLDAMYDLTGDPLVLAKARDLGDRLLRAFASPSGLPYYYVNLKTGATKGTVICAAEAGSYIFEFGALSRFTHDPKYYRAAKRASERVYGTRSAIGLIGKDYDVTTGAGLDHDSLCGCYVDSYYEYLYKGWRLLGDPELKTMWDTSIAAVNRYLAAPRDGKLWYGMADSVTGRLTGTSVTLWDAYFPALLIYAGHPWHGERAFAAWNGLWRQYGLLPMEYDFATGKVTNPRYYLNPELMESCYYMIKLAGRPEYAADMRQYYADLKRYCRNDVAYSQIADIATMRQEDALPSFFFAETLKYLYLGFAQPAAYDFQHVVFSTEAHPLRPFAP